MLIKITKISKTTKSEHMQSPLNEEAIINQMPGFEGNLVSKTTHHILFGDARSILAELSGRFALLVTSPPYPMIEMWDNTFSELDPAIRRALDFRDDDVAFKLMHNQLDSVWTTAYTKLLGGGIACINIGDATRKIDDTFKLYSNHSHILETCTTLGFHALPEILWRKQSNKPNKFMGSGMLPGGAYITQEHEYILVLRRGGKREFATDEQKLNRRRSAFFWEERNKWFSDIWDDIKGDRQESNHENLRQRTAAYPFELCSRLISMFSARGDFVLDPYLGTATTTLAAMATGRNSVGIELDSRFSELIKSRVEKSAELANKFNLARLEAHLQFIKEQKAKGEKFKHQNVYYDFPVVTSQEEDLRLPFVKQVRETGDHSYEVEYSYDVPTTEL